MANYKSKSKDMDKDRDFKPKSGKKPTGKRRPPYKGKDDKREEGKATRRYSEETSAIGDNDPSWYIPDPVVMEQATRMSFSNFIGVDVELDPTNSVPNMPVTKLKPGAAMQVFFNPSPGYTTFDDPKTAAINQQAFRTYARLSSINAKNTLYTPNDVATIILAMGELIKMFSVAQRAYGLLWTYNVRNRVMPADLVTLSGIDVNTISGTAADYLTTLNTLVVEANKIPFPGNIEYFKHCAQMFNGVYQDSESSMAELYIPLPFSTWELKEDVQLEGTRLQTREFYPSVADFEPMDGFEFLEIIREMIDNLMTSNTYNLVYSDIVNLATKDPNVNILRFMPVEPNYAVVPTYDKEWLLKINNATIVGRPLATDDQLEPAKHTTSNDVAPYKDILSLVYAPQWTRVIPDLGLQKIINFYTDAPTLEERIIATRLMMGSGLDQAPLKGKDPIALNYYTNQTVGMGDHYIVGVSVWTRYNSITGPDYSTESSGTDITTNDTPSILTRFSQHPYIYEFSTDEVHSTHSLEGLVGDMDFFTTMDYDVLARINRLALFALFDLKDVNK